MFDLFQLQRYARVAGDRIEEAPIAAVRQLLIESPLADRRQGLFLFREAAGFLANVMVHGGGLIADAAYGALRSVLESGSGFAHRTAAESLGSLPHGILPPRLPPETGVEPPVASWQRLQRAAGKVYGTRLMWRGRSLVAGGAGSRRLLVCKFARRGESARDLAREILWMSHVGVGGGKLPVRFDVPRPVCIEGSPLFRLPHPPDAAGAPAAEVDPTGTAVAFEAAADYFRYPNGSGVSARLSKSAFRAVMDQNAFLLGRLAAGGMLHTAPIPLFHNRVQVHRRRDRGRYEWYRAGRLDRWLASCAFPNFGPTGLRDFEHLEPLGDGPLALYRCIGTHFVSLLLVLGSYFRNREPHRVGRDPGGAPVDARALFDPDMMCDTILSMFVRYCEGFTGRRPVCAVPVDVARLVFRMIEEMGVDRHMEEILRQPDQEQMSDDAFERFLRERGSGSNRPEKGAADIVLDTGPHLGAFNDTISLPELIRAVEAFAGLAVAEKYSVQQRRKNRRMRTGGPDLSEADEAPFVRRLP
ncbi:MAG: SidJ-related pseudokinase [Desulfobacterales bacterium]